MKRLCSDQLLLALICAVFIAGCGAASKPAPGSSSAGSTSATTQSAAQPVSDPLDLCRLPDLPPPGVLSRSGYAQLAVSLTDQNGEPIGGLKRSDFTVRSGTISSPIVYFKEESSAPVSLVIVGDVSESIYRKTVVLSDSDREKARSALDGAEGQLNECDEAALVMIGVLIRSQSNRRSVR